MDLTKYEKARIISARAFQLALNAPPTVKPKKGEAFELLAKRELENSTVPLEVKRKRKK